MPNVLKGRHLSDNQKLTPKSDYVYSVRSVEGNNQVIYNNDGTIKHTIIDAQNDHYQYTSVGKGQYMFLRPSPSAGAQLFLKNKEDDSTVSYISLGLLDDGSWNATQIQETKMIEFIGKPFKASGNEDRYAIILSRLVGDGNWYSSLFNIDTFTVEANFMSGSTIMYDYTYDGTDKVYFILGDGNRVIEYTLNGNWVILTDPTGANLQASKIYGITGQYMWIKYPGFENLYVYDMTTWSGPMAQFIEGKNVVTDSTNWIIANQYDSEIHIQEITQGLLYNATQSIIDAGVDTSTGKFYPVLFQGFDQSPETAIMTFNWIGVKENAEGTERTHYSVITTIDIINGGTTISTVKQGITDTTVDTIEKIVNAFSNSCNSYNVGKFYSTGLQKQWDNS